MHGGESADESPHVGQVRAVAGRGKAQKAPATPSRLPREAKDTSVP
jgi:hypothetical protein